MLSLFVRARLMCLCAVSVVLAAPAFADVLHLTNGDRITGDVVSIKGGVVTITTSYAGDIEIQQNEVSAIDTDEAVAVQSEDGSISEGRLEQRDDAQVLVLAESDDATLVTDLVRLAANTEALHEQIEKDKPKLRGGSVDLGAALRSGTTDTLDATFGLRLVRTTPRHVLTLRGAGAYGEVDSQKNTERLFGEAKWQIYVNDRFYGYTLISAEHDAGRKLDLRLIGGGGMGYDFIKNDRRKLSAEAGIEYAKEWWERYDLAGERAAREAAEAAARADVRAFLDALSAATAPPTFSDLGRAYQVVSNLLDPDYDNETREEDRVTLRLGGKYEQVLFERSRISEELTYFPTLEDVNDFRITSLLAFTTPIAQRLNLKVSLLTEYDNDPRQPGIEELDNTLLTSLNYAF